MEIKPSVSIWDIPFGLNIYLLSLNSSNRQNINRTSFNFDLDQLKSKITDRLKEKVSSLALGLDSAAANISNIGSSIDADNPLESAEELGLVSCSEKFFMDFKTMDIGKTYTTYSELTTNGVLVNGLNIEYNPEILYLAFAAGNNAEAINNVSLKRSFISGRFDWVKKKTLI